jgi:hypothetical protein
MKPYGRLSQEELLELLGILTRWDPSVLLGPAIGEDAAARASWRWDFGDGTTSSDRNPTHAYTSPGTYTVTLTVRDERGAERSVSKTIQVKAMQAASTSAYVLVLAAAVLVLLAVIAASYVLLKRRVPKLLPPPPPRTR